MLYTINLDTNNYVLSIAHTPNDNIELDLSTIDLAYLNAYQLVDNELLLDEGKRQAMIGKQSKQSNEEEIARLKAELTQYDYIGVKIAMGVATKEEYSEQIAYTETIREQIRQLESEVE